MKRAVFLMLCMVLAFSSGVLAAEKNPTETLSETLGAYVSVGPYAKIEPQRVVVKKDCWWYAWTEDDPGMDFGFYDGKAGYGKAADSNCFILETNTGVTVTFKGESLTHTEYGDKMLTRYSAWLSRGVDDLPEPYLFVNIPKQIQPYKEIGFFGEAGKAPRKDSGGFIEQILFEVLELLGLGNRWPTEYWNEEHVAISNHVNQKGIYAFQVFGFASTDEISSQRAGTYEGKIIVTVSK